MTIIYADGVNAIMEERGIREEDIVAVIEASEATGAKLVAEETGKFLGKKRLNNVTVYVEYAVEGENAVVADVYSHMVTFTDETEGN